MITIFEKFKTKKPPKFKIGDRVIWIYTDEPKTLKTKSVTAGDVCEITNIKTEYSLAEPRYMVRARNLETGRMINLLWGRNGVRRPYNINGHWLDDYLFVDELEYNMKKYNL